MKKKSRVVEKIRYEEMRREKDEERRVETRRGEGKSKRESVCMPR